MKKLIAFITGISLTICFIEANAQRQSHTNSHNNLPNVQRGTSPSQSPSSLQRSSNVSNANAPGGVGEYMSNVNDTSDLNDVTNAVFADDSQEQSCPSVSSVDLSQAYIDSDTRYYLPVNSVDSEGQADTTIWSLQCLDGSTTCLVDMISAFDGFDGAEYINYGKVDPVTGEIIVYWALYCYYLPLDDSSLYFARTTDTSYLSTPLPVAAIQDSMFDGDSVWHKSTEGQGIMYECNIKNGDITNASDCLVDYDQ